MKEFLKNNKNVIIGFSVFTFMLILDIASKKIVHNSMKMYDEIEIIPYLFNFIHVHNTGAAFGSFGDSPAAMIVFIVISLIASLILGFGLVKYGNKSKVLSIGLGLIIAGAIGNAIDRISLGYVDDFIQFAFWKNFAIFNFADVGVICGLAVFMVYVIFIYKEPKKEAKRDASKEQDNLKKNDEEEVI